MSKHNIEAETERILQNSYADKDYKKVFEVISRAFMDNPQNIYLIDYVRDEFIKDELFNELVELYKLEFIYTSNPVCFEKMGDIYMKTEEYDQALDAYLNCAEISEDYPDIYLKLADVFGKLNDNDSRLACLKQAGVDTI